MNDIFDITPTTSESRFKETVMRDARRGGITTLTPKGAALILEQMNFPGQRAINAAQVYGHTHAIIRGDWMEGHAMTFAELPDGRIWLVDGQHRLTAISQQSENVPVTIRLVPVENEKEAGEFYSGFDQKTSVRSTKQIIHATQACDDSGLSVDVAAAVFAASTLLDNDLIPATNAQNNKNREIFLLHTRMSAIAAWKKEALIYSGIMDIAQRSLRAKMMQAGIMAVALYTLRYQGSKAVDFWTGFATQANLGVSDPRQALYADCMTRKLNCGSSKQRVQQPTLAWNAFFQGRKLQIIKCLPDSKVVILGTPLAKGAA